MLQRVKEVQESDLRMVGALARNIQRVIAVTQADIDAAAAQGKAWVVKPVVKVSDPLDNLRGGTQLVIKQNSILPGQNVMRVMYIGGQAVVVGPGTSPLSLPDAVAGSLVSLKAFGGTEQNGTPAPDAPVDIVCNNGVLKYSRNLFNKNNSDVGNGYINYSTGNVTGTSRGHTGYFVVEPGQTYHVTLPSYQTGSANGIAFYDSTKTYVSGATSGNSYGVSPYNFTVPNDNTIVYARLTLTDNIADTNLDAIQIEKGSTGTTVRPYGQIYTDGTVETIAIKDDQNATVSTATCEDLLSVGDYTDEQEVISGGVTRKVGVLVLDGTENWQVQSGTNPYLYAVLSDTVFHTSAASELITHFVRTAIGVNNNAQSLYIGTKDSTKSALFFRYGSIAPSTTAGINTLKTWLAEQYAAGTPVIVVYPLATPTTESVAGQPMQTVEGDNTAEITQASLNNLELQVEYIGV